MPREQRAKQFSSFDALKGLHDELKEKEKEHENRIKNQRKLEKIDDEN